MYSWEIWLRCLNFLIIGSGDNEFREIEGQARPWYHPEDQINKVRSLPDCQHNIVWQFGPFEGKTGKTVEAPNSLLLMDRQSYISEIPERI